MSWTRKDLCFGLLQLAAVLAFPAQLWIDHEPVNLACTALVVLSSSLVIQYLWRSDAPQRHPVSSLALLGLCVTTQYAALLAQTLDGAPLVALLRWPETTFAVLALVQGLAVLAHFIHRHLAAPQVAADRIMRLVLTPLHVMDTPSVPLVWAMAAVGALAMATGGGVATGDVGGKVFQALNFLAYMPFLIPLYHRLHGRTYCDMKTQGPLVLGYVLVLALVGVALNARQQMAIGPVQALLMYLMYSWGDERPVTRRTIQWLGVGTVVLGVLIALFAQLAVAMVLVRDKRDSLAPLALMQETLDAFMDQRRIALYHEDALLDARYKVFDETYLSNPVMARFSETKFHDNTIQFGLQLDDRERAELWEMTLMKTIAILPQNLLDALEIPVDKDAYTFSFGDYYRYLHEGPDNTLGGFSVGSVWAHLLGLFGIAWFPVVVLLMTIPSFLYLDSFMLRGGHVIVAPVMMCCAWSLFSYALGGESLVWKIGYYLRDLPQKVLLYALVYGAIVQVGRLFGRSLAWHAPVPAEATGPLAA